METRRRLLNERFCSTQHYVVPNLCVDSVHMNFDTNAGCVATRGFWEERNKINSSCSYGPQNKSSWCVEEKNCSIRGEQKRKFITSIRQSPQIEQANEAPHINDWISMVATGVRMVDRG